MTHAPTAPRPPAAVLASMHSEEMHSHIGQAMAHADAAAESEDIYAAEAHTAARLAHDIAADAHATTARIWASGDDAIAIAAARNAERCSESAWIATATATDTDGI